MKAVNDLSAADPTLELPYAHGGPVGQGRIRVVPEDFVVEENLGFQPSGNGEHVFLRLRKRNLNTHEVAQRLARLAGVREVDVGYAGRKDKRAVTTQAFSVRMTSRPEPDWWSLQGDELRVLEATRHQRKIRRGCLRGNRFRIRIRDVHAGVESLQARLERIGELGVPNYFGSQRFGNGGGNLSQARLLFESNRQFDRNRRNVLFSAVRGWLFNRVVAMRVRDGSWRQMLPGDVFQLAGTKRLFVPDAYDASVTRRIREADIHPTAPLVGRPSRVPRPGLTTAAMEHEILADFDYWTGGLIAAGLDADRRATRLLAHELDWDVHADGVEVTFELPAGAYATVVLRELLDVAGCTAVGPSVRTAERNEPL